MSTTLLVQLPNLLGFCGMLIAGNQRRLGWALGVASEFAWAWYAYAAHAPGLYPWCVIWGAMFARNWIKWTREKKRAVPVGLRP